MKRKRRAGERGGHAVRTSDGVRRKSLFALPPSLSFSSFFSSPLIQPVLLHRGLLGKKRGARLLLRVRVLSEIA